MATTLIRTLTGTSHKSQNEAVTANGAPMDLSKITTTNTQTGVLNHLTPEQETLLEEFKERLAKDGWYSPDGVNGKPTHDDGTLLRYLRARKFDVQGAVGQFTDTEKWMKEQEIEDLYEHFDVEFFERARTLYPQWTGHRDKRGIPIYVYEIKGLDRKNVDKYQKESAAYKAKLPKQKDVSTAPKLLPLFALYHNLLNFVLPLCSSLERARPEIPITNSTNIVDISGVSLRQFWNLKSHMQDASTLATAHYPETLDRIFIIGAPSFFPTVWGWVKGWFDPVTVSKIFIIGAREVKPTLEKFMDPASIPEKYGGKLNWQWGDIPDLDEETKSALERDGNRGWVKGPALWLNNERIVVGSENGKLRRSEKEIAEKKPIVYAADYTEDPVHPEKRLSIVSASKKSLDVRSPIQGATVLGHPSPLPESPSTLVEDRQLGAPVTLPPPATSVQDHAPTPTRNHEPIQNEISSHIPRESVRTSPMGDSQVHLPSDQAAPPSTTAEYISPTPSRVQLASSREQHKPSILGAVNNTPLPGNQNATSDQPEGAPNSAPAAVLTSAPDVSSRPTTAGNIASPPPGHTQPGPLSAHTAELNRAIARQLERESTIEIPASANGALPHPDIISTSDPTKGLAMETEKLALAGGAHAGRPQPERFVTALEVLH